MVTRRRTDEQGQTNFEKLGAYKWNFSFVKVKKYLWQTDICAFIVSEFEELYRQEETYDPAMSMFDFAGGPCYDHIWVAALALNCTDAYLKAIGRTH